MNVSDRLANRISVLASLFLVLFSSMGAVRQVGNLNRSSSSFSMALLVIFLGNTLVGVALSVLAMKRVRS